MPTSIDLPVIGKVDQRWAWAGGALVVGVVSYAWISKSRQTGPVPEDMLGLGEPEDLAGVGGLGFLGEGSGTTGEREQGFGFDTNAEWAQFAVDYLGRFGVEQDAASLAIGKFLGREPLDASERDFVRRAIGIAGEPPVDRPWQIIPAQGPPAAQPPSTLHAPHITSVQRSGRTVAFVWTGVPGAVGYDISEVDPLSSKILGATRVSAGTLVHERHYRQAGERIGIAVRAAGENNTLGPWATHFAIGQN